MHYKDLFFNTIEYIVVLGTWIIINGLAQDCSNSTANTLELLQFCAEPLISYTAYWNTKSSHIWPSFQFTIIIIAYHFHTKGNITIFLHNLTKKLSNIIFNIIMNTHSIVSFLSILQLGQYHPPNAFLYSSQILLWLFPSTISHYYVSVIGNISKLYLH